ncbi:MAG: FAD-dependent oxidoreductase [Chloroflexi bacterium]|nr:FAD-dependent oxidoreductase [Chloroflexota bacterium]
MSASSTPDVAIIGGGVVGCAIAYRLAKSGLSVVLIERDGIASHASGNAYGGLYATFGPGMPGPALDVAKRSIELHKTFDPQIESESDIATEFRPSRSIDVAFNESELNEINENVGWWESAQLPFEHLTPESILELEPNLTPNIVGGVRHLSHYEVDSYKLTLALATAFERHGGTIRSGNVISLAQPGEITLASGASISAPVRIVCSGPWAGTDEIAGMPELPIRPVKGEIIRLAFPGDDFSHRVVAGRPYIARKPDGLVWIGTTDEEAGFDETASASARDSILAGALSLAPVLETASIVQHTACLRPTSSDGLPIVGQVDDGLYVANGAGSKGILYSHVIAGWIADSVLEGSDSVPPEFAVSRFL